jgi:orotidine-5'-phosphate decarboxylase|tara:strand:- start:258 stop:959 length:702 start_codon:yes stop_codon:yes gene_type:complete
MQRIIQRDKSIIPACDFPYDKLLDVLESTFDIEEIGGYKIPAISGRVGWEKWVNTIRGYTDKPLIYDHQKAGTDIPDTATTFMKEIKSAGFDAIILFPLSGPKTQEAWIKAAQDSGLGVIVGGEMTHKGFKASEGGYINDFKIDDIYYVAADLGVTDFVVPGNRLDSIERIKKIVDSSVKGDSVFYAPGFIAQSGEITEAGKAVGERFHAIVGRGIYQAENMMQVTLDLTSKL